MRRPLLAAAFLGVMAGGAAADTLEQEEALEILERIASAARQLNYVGTFVYQHADRFETSRIVHYVDSTGEYEKLETLDGPRREVIRNNDEVLCYYPDAKVVRSEKRVARRTFPALLPERLHALTEFYRIRKGDPERIAGYDSQALILEPKDGLRYGHKLWADTDTGLLLKARMLNEGNLVVEQFTFTELRIGSGVGRGLGVQSLRASPLGRGVAPDAARDAEDRGCTQQAGRGSRACAHDQDTDATNSRSMVHSPWVVAELGVQSVNRISPVSVPCSSGELPWSRSGVRAPPGGSRCSSAPAGSTLRFPAAFPDQRADPRPDFVADPAHLIQRPAAGILERPVYRGDSRNHGARVSASHRHEYLRGAGQLAGEAPGTRSGKIDPHFVHRGNDEGMHSIARRGPRGKRSRQRRIGELIEEGRGHLGSPRVVHAGEQHGGHPSGFRPRTKAPMNRPSIAVATTSVSSPAPSRKPRASSIR